MEIYIVQPGDTINSIADKFGVPLARLIEDNGLTNFNSLVTGQAIIILFPSKTYTVQEGDTLGSIAQANGITIMQLLRNNPFLNSRNNIYPGEILVISYDTTYNITTNGYTYSFINRNRLKMTLPYLTYLSIFNYGTNDDGGVITYEDDIDIIQLAKMYGTTPLLMISSLTPLGALNPKLVYDILLNEEKNNKLIQNIVDIVNTKGFKGVNILVSNINLTNQGYYIKFFTKVSDALSKYGYILIVTINPNIRSINNTIIFEKLDYNSISKIVNQIVFIQYAWGINKEPPGPVSSIQWLSTFLDYIESSVENNNISLGKPLIGYDWALPYIQGKTVANSLTLDSAITLANDHSVAIQFDEVSQTPFYNYVISYVGELEEHIVWFIDARSIKALDDMIIQNNLAGSGIWNINYYNQQLWSLLNSSFNIIKPDFEIT